MKIKGLFVRLLLVSILFGSTIACCYGQQSKSYNTIASLFTTPEGYERMYVNNDYAYATWLVSHPLKDNPEVLYFDGHVKHNNNIYAAVFDYEIGDRDLHHCADAAIYLRASYNYSSGPEFYDRLKFTFTNGFVSSYTEWLRGAIYNLINNGRDIKVSYGRKRQDNCKTFRQWLDQVFSYAGTWSIEQYDLEPISIVDIEPGDVFVQGGFPGHAVTVVDVAIDSKGHKVFMLAQSYMPAQEQHILLNPATGDVWYSAYGWNFLSTPEYTFESKDLYRWKN